MKSFSMNSIFYVILIISLVSCKKKDDHAMIPPQEGIIYTDIEPDISCTSIKGWTSWLGYNVPVPNDSTAEMFLDLDQDSIPDIRVNVSTVYQHISVSNPSNNYNYASRMHMLSEENGIAFQGTSGPCCVAKPFSADSTISAASTYRKDVATYGRGSYVPICFCNTFSGDTYFGFNLSRKGGSNFGWILMSFSPGSNRLTVKEFAINMAPNKAIKAGQIN